MSELRHKKRKSAGTDQRRPTSKKLRRQYAYSSGSSDSENVEEHTATDAPPDRVKPKAAKHDRRKHQGVPVTHHKVSAETALPEAGKDAAPSNVEEDDDSASDGTDASSSETGSQDETNGTKNPKKKTKRRDPDVFADSLAAILSSKLPTSKRHDPVLARSKAAEEANHEIAEERLEVKAKRKMRDEKRQAKERGRVKDVLLGDRGIDLSLRLADAEGNESTLSTAEIVEQERRFRKTAQRGVVKLFNAVRAAQVRTEQAQRSVRAKGVVGLQQREEKVGDMGRQAFLDMVSGGGKAKT